MGGSFSYRDRTYQAYSTSSSNIIRPNPRLLSTSFFSSPSPSLHSLTSLRGRTSLLAFYGQQVHTELSDGSVAGCPLEYMNIPIPRCDEIFDPECTGTQSMPYTRSKYAMQTGQGPSLPRSQLSATTAWLDGSSIYGTSKTWCDEMRSRVGGKMKSIGDDDTTVTANLPSFNTAKMPYTNIPPPTDNPGPGGIHKPHLRSVSEQLMTGSKIGNENPALLALQIMWWRNHNYHASRLASLYRDNSTGLLSEYWSDTRLFHAARAWNIAEYQSITMYEWLPVWLGLNDSTGIPAYTGYKSTINPGISEVFTTSAMQWIHTLIPSYVMRRDLSSTQTASQCQYLTTGSNKKMNTGSEGKRAWRLCNTWWRGSEMIVGDGDDTTDTASSSSSDPISSLLLGLSSSYSSAEDLLISPDIQSYMYGSLSYNRKDLIAQTIQMGRDFGIPGYNEVRKMYGLNKKAKMEEITSDPQLQSKLTTLYQNSTDSIDLYIGGMLETTPSGNPGELFTKIILDQFTRLRDADRFWFENQLRSVSDGGFSVEDILVIRNTKMNDLLKRHIPQGAKLNKEAFVIGGDAGECHPTASGASNNTSAGDNLGLLSLDSCTPLSTHDYWDDGNSSMMLYATIILLVGWIILCIIGVYIILWKEKKKRERVIREIEASFIVPRKSTQVRTAELQRFFQNLISTSIGGTQLQPTSTKAAGSGGMNGTTTNGTANGMSGKLVHTNSQSLLTQNPLHASGTGSTPKLQPSTPANGAAGMIEMSPLNPPAGPSGSAASTATATPAIPNTPTGVDGSSSMYADGVASASASQRAESYPHPNLFVSTASPHHVAAPLSEVDAAAAAPGASSSIAPSVKPDPAAVNTGATTTNTTPTLRDRPALLLVPSLHQLEVDAVVNSSEPPHTLTSTTANASAQRSAMLKSSPISRNGGAITSTNRASRNRRPSNATTSAGIAATPLAAAMNAFSLDVTQTEALLDTGITLSEFAEALELESTHSFPRQIFQMADYNHTGLVSFRALEHILLTLSKGSRQDKLRLLFNLYDMNASGYLEIEEITTMLRESLRLAEMEEYDTPDREQRVEEEIQEAISEMYEKIEKNPGDSLEFSDFEIMMTSEQGGGGGGTGGREQSTTRMHGETDEKQQHSDDAYGKQQLLLQQQTPAGAVASSGALLSTRTTPTGAVAKRSIIDRLLHRDPSTRVRHGQMSPRRAKKEMQQQQQAAAKASASLPVASSSSTANPTGSSKRTHRRDPTVSSWNNNRLDSHIIMTKVSGEEKRRRSLNSGGDGDGHHNHADSILPHYTTPYLHSTRRSRLMRIRTFINTYRSHIFILVLFYLITFGIFIERFWSFAFQTEHIGIRRITGWSVPITRGCASSIAFTVSLLLLTVCKNLLSYLQTTRSARFIPFASMQTFHIVCAYTCLFFICGHIIGHGFNWYQISTQSPQDAQCYLPDVMINSDSVLGFGVVVYLIPTNMIGILLTLFMIVFYIAAIFRNMIYSVFIQIHKYFIFVYLGIILHGMHQLFAYPVFWPFFIGPAVIYICDKLWSFTRVNHPLQVIQAQILPSKVVKLVIAKPSHLSYSSGQFIRLSSDFIKQDVWHPFSVTSAPNQDYISVHVRAVGPWTYQLFQLYHPVHLKMRGAGVEETTVVKDQEKLQHPQMTSIAVVDSANCTTAVTSSAASSSPITAEKPTNGNRGTIAMLPASSSDIIVPTKPTHPPPSERICAGFIARSLDWYLPPINIDGPFGGGHSEWKKFRTVILIGAGIGITPFASILQDFMHHVSVERLQEKEKERKRKKKYQAQMQAQQQLPQGIGSVGGGTVAIAAGGVPSSAQSQSPSGSTLSNRKRNRLHPSMNGVSGVGNGGGGSHSPSAAPTRQNSDGSNVAGPPQHMKSSAAATAAQRHVSIDAGASNRGGPSSSYHRSSIGASNSSSSSSSSSSASRQPLKLYFVWIARSHAGYEWLIDMIREAESLDHSTGRLHLQVQLYITTPPHQFDLRTAISYAFEMHFDRWNGCSLFSGLRSSIGWGRPDFNHLFDHIAARHPRQQVGVFSSGGLGVLDGVQKACDRVNGYKGSHFHHHAEQFQ